MVPLTAVAESDNFHSTSDNKTSHVQYIIECNPWRLWSVPKGRNGLIHTQYHCRLSFRDFQRILSNEQSCCCSLHLSVLQHRNWRASSSVVDRDDYKVAKLYLEYWWTTDYACLYFGLSWLFTNSQQQTNCPRRAFIFWFCNIGLGEPRFRLLTATPNKSLSFISNIDEPLTLRLSLFLSELIFQGSWATNQLSAASLHNLVLQHRNWRASSSVVDQSDYKVARIYLEYWWTTDYDRIYFYLSWFSTDPEQQTNCPRRAFIIWSTT